MELALNRRRAVFVLGKIDEILSWGKSKEHEKDVHFVELGQCLCEVRSKQYWRLEKLKSFDEFLEKRFPDSRRKAYYLMAIHEHLPRQIHRDLKLVGWTKARELVKVARARVRQKRPPLKLGPKEYAIVRARVLERDGWRCQECGSIKGIEVHHYETQGSAR
ncbi:MAG TPA: hypothetical protein VMI32_18380 [Candidatus Solibacter sp.]|nr:hypothetical protein [Candidatus Solibacter sp.]